MVYQNLSIENLISTKIFDNKPSIKEIINFIATTNSDLMDNDREFCYLFDAIASSVASVISSALILG